MFFIHHKEYYPGLTKIEKMDLVLSLSKKIFFLKLFRQNIVLCSLKSHTKIQAFGVNFYSISDIGLKRHTKSEKRRKRNSFHGQYLPNDLSKISLSPWPSPPQLSQPNSTSTQVGSDKVLSRTTHSNF